jgi:hypothetical protein
MGSSCVLSLLWDTQTQMKANLEANVGPVGSDGLRARGSAHRRSTRTTHIAQIRRRRSQEAVRVIGGAEEH